MSLHAFESLVAGRRSIRRFAEAPLPQETVRRLLAAACRAPSAHNRQPWRFVVLARGEVRRKLVRAMAVRYRRDLEADGVPQEEVAVALARSEQRLLGAPVLVLVCMTLEDMDTYPDPERQSAERIMAVQSVALAAGHLLLAAHAHGLGACWMCAPLFALDTVRDVLSLPQAWEPQAFILIGQPGESGRDRPRKSVEEVALFL